MLFPMTYSFDILTYTYTVTIFRHRSRKGYLSTARYLKTQLSGPKVLDGIFQRLSKFIFFTYLS